MYKFILILFLKKGALKIVYYLLKNKEKINNKAIKMIIV